MKKIINAIAFLIFFNSNNYAQTIMQASLGIGSTSNAVKVYIKTSTVIAAPFTISTLQFDIAIPITFLPRPTPTITPNGVNFPGVTWFVNNASEDGFYHYMLTTAISPTYFKLDASETEVLEIAFSGAGTTNISLVTLPLGGLGATNGNALFYTTSLNVNSDGSNLYYIRPGTTVNNAFSYNAAGSAGNAISTAIISTPLLLPTNFLAFSATATNGHAHLTWSIQNESNNTNYYEIERSVNGIIFNKIATVIKNNNSNNIKIYNSIDANIQNINDVSLIVYYRIKQVAFNGSFFYSDVKIVALNNSIFSISAYPNPINENVNIRFALDIAQNVKMFLLNSEGKLLQVFMENGKKGVNLKNINMHKLAAGNYMLSVQIGQNMETIKLTKL